MDRVINHSRQSWSNTALAGAANYLVAAAAYTALYAGLDRLSLVYEFKGLGISLWSPSIGLSVALLLAYGPGFTPVVFAAIFLTDLYVHALSRETASIAVTAAILASGYATLSWFLQHQLGFELKRAHLKDVIILLVAMPVGIIGTSFTYCASLYLMGYLPGSLFWSGMQRLWIGDTMGTVIVVPAIMAGIMAVNRGSHVRVDAAIVDAGTFLLGVAGAFWVIFRLSKTETTEFQFFYLLFLPVIWIAIRAGFEGAAFAIFVLHVALVAITKLEGFHGADFMAFQEVMLALVATGLLLGAMVTERRETEEHLREQRAALSRMSRYATAGAMGVSLAHQISQPLSTIATYLHAARRLLDRSDPAAVAEALDKAQTEARRAREVLERLKDFLAHGRMELAHTDLIALASKITQLSAAEAAMQGVQIRIAGFGRLIVRADPIQIEQVLLNLIANAVDAAAERGDGKGLVTVRFSDRASIAGVSVEDNGPGIAPEIAERLLEPFQTTKPKGMGLGLALSRQIIEAHSGHLHWTSLKPSGTRFTFELQVEGPERNVA